MSASHDAPLATGDLFLVVELGSERLAGLLLPDEEAVCERILRLRGEPGQLFARISSRRRTAIPVEAQEGVAVDYLVAEGLLREGASWVDRLEASTVAELRQWCVVRGLDVRGRKAALQARLRDAAPVAPVRRWVSRPHRRLIRRLERAAFLDRRADRGQLVAERLGHVRWPSYEPTSGGAIFPDREHLLAWEELLSASNAERLHPAAALAGLARGHGQAPGRLSIAHRLLRCVTDHADGLRRAGAVEEARAWLDALAVGGGTGLRLGLERARMEEACGRPRRALARLLSARESAQGARRLAVERSGRRLARAQRSAWPPDPPLRPASDRRLLLAAGAREHRPQWRVGERDLLVEPAVQAVIADLGRDAVRAEGGWLRTLFVLLFARVLLHPVAGQLPVPRLSGPLDLGTPGFAARRPSPVFAVLDAIAAGQGPDLVREACARFDGVRLAGRARDLSRPQSWERVAEDLGPQGLRAVLTPVLARGWVAFKGFPDLFVHAGAPVRLPHAHPTKLASPACFVEVKGPGDTLSDAQRVWIDRLLAEGVAVEVWTVRPRG